MLASMRRSEMGQKERQERWWMKYPKYWDFAKIIVNWGVEKSEQQRIRSSLIGKKEENLERSIS